MRANFRGQTAIKDRVQNLRANLIVHLARKLKRIQPVLGKPIDNVIVNLIATRPVQCYAPKVKRWFMNVFDLEIHGRYPRHSFAPWLRPAASDKSFEELVDRVQSAARTFAY